MKHFYIFLFLIPALFGGFTMAAESGPCDAACKQNVPIDLGYNCQYTVQVHDVLHYPPPSCYYTVTVYNSSNQPIGATVNSSHAGQTLNVKVTSGAWFCWASIYVTGGSGGGGPVAICDVNTQVSLTSNGKARVYWQTFDDGSYVSCGQVASIKIRREVPGWCPPGCIDDTQFRDFVELCCEDIANSPVKVILRVYDYYGNYNDCWVKVYVEDKLKPKIHCPPDITVSCDYHIDYNNLGHYFGKVHMNNTHIQPIYVNDPHYYPHGGHAGYDGYVEGGGCNQNNLWVYESYHTDFTCGTGIIYRTFTIENTYYTCTQKIYVRDPYPFGYGNIHWPPNVELPDCGPNNTDPSVTGRPTWYDDDCSMIATSYRDEVFTIAENACFKILRHWSILDWCQYKPNGPYGQKGRWDYTQVIKLKNSDAPMFPTCDDVTFCTTDVIGCKGKAPLIGNATDDCTADSLLNYHWCIDLNNDGIGQYQGSFDLQGHGRNATGFYPFGTHKILWRVEDLCGNFNTCSYLFTVEDCKKPSPVCLGAISTVVMPSSGMIELTAKHFDASSFDNCTEEEDLIFSFSEDVTETTRVFTCNNIGTNEVKIYVTDEAGNQQFCTAFLVLDDNDMVCPDSPMTLVHGTILTVAGDPVIGTEVSMETGSISIKNFIKIDETGVFDFGSFAEIEPTDFPLSISKSDDPLNGVSVLDLLLLQKHILEIKYLDDPYVMVAADVNNDQVVDARDLLETKLVMLKRKSIFSQNTSWLYMQDVAGMNPQFADRNDFLVAASTDVPTEINLIGVKIADLNGSATLDAVGADTRSKESMTTPDLFTKADQSISIPLSFNGIDIVAGAQLDLQILNDYIEINKVLNHLGESIDFTYENNLLSILWVDANTAAAATEQFTIVGEAKKAGWLSEFISLQEHNSIVDLNENEYAVDLVFDGQEITDVEMIDMQFLPNPFRFSTDLVMKNQHGDSGFITILDQTGKQIAQRPVHEDENVVRFVITNDMLPSAGLYWVKAQIGEVVSVKKLIHLE